MIGITGIRTNPVRYIDPNGEELWNPLTWDWDKISSAFKFKLGAGLGYHAKIKVSKLKASIGAKAIVGVALEGRDKAEIYLHAVADAIRVEFGNDTDPYYLLANIGYEYEARIDPRNKTAYEKIDDQLLNFKAGPRKGKAKSSNNDWLEVGGSVTIKFVEVGGSINFWTIFEGMLNEQDE